MQLAAPRRKRRASGTLVQVPKTWKPKRSPSWIEKRGKKKVAHYTLGDAACSTSPRWVRGSIGFLIGGVLGGMVGGAIALSQLDIGQPISTVKRMALISSGVTAIGAIGGLWIGAAKPEC
jgi:hypothetical protein